MTDHRAPKVRAHREQSELLEEGARLLRARAIEDSYAGARGQYVAFALAAVLEHIAMTPDGVPEQLLASALTAARRIVHGPDGPHDPRAQHTALTDGPGH